MQNENLFQRSKQKYLTKNIMENHEKKQITLNRLLMAPFGGILLVVAIIMNKYCPETSSFDFITGFLFGLSLVLNIAYIFLLTSKKRKQPVTYK
jgi:hypothetical protein